MTFEIKEQNEKMVVNVNGRLDTPAAVKAQQEIVPLLENANKEIQLDCNNLEYISSSGLRLFLTIRKEAAAKGGKVIIFAKQSRLFAWRTTDSIYIARCS